MTKSLLGNENAKRGYLISSDGAHKAPDLAQDTPKEDYILCDSCEKYFSVLETYIATRLHNRLWDIRCKSQFTTFTNRGVEYKVCEQIHPIIFRLFIYSIVWRCSISSTKAFNSFSLGADESETLRAALNTCKFDKRQNLLDNIDQLSPSVPTLPFSFFTADSFGDRTENILFINRINKNTYILFLNEYILTFSFDINNQQSKIDFLSNTDNSKIKIGYFSEEYWVTLRRNQFFMIWYLSMSNLKKIGETPWIIKQEQQSKHNP